MTNVSCNCLLFKNDVYSCIQCAFIFYLPNQQAMQSCRALNGNVGLKIVAKRWLKSFILLLWTVISASLRKLKISTHWPFSHNTCIFPIHFISRNFVHWHFDWQTSENFKYNIIVLFRLNIRRSTLNAIILARLVDIILSIFRQLNCCLKSNQLNLNAIFETWGVLNVWTAIDDGVLWKLIFESVYWFSSGCSCRWKTKSIFQ